MKSPEGKLWRGLAVSTGLIALALFLAARTIDYWRAWVYLAISVATGISLVRHMARDPILRESRARLGLTAEQRPVQKIILMLTAIPLVAAYVVPGLDRRFGWSSVPAWLSIAGDLLIALCGWSSACSKRIPSALRRSRSVRAR